MLRKLKEEEKTESIRRKETYEALRHQFMFDVESKLMPVVNDVQGFYDWIVGESKAFRNVMREYGQLRMRQGEETATFSVVDGNFKLEVKSNKVKSFDERADLAAERLIDYLKNYIAHSEKGVDDPMYQMAMTLLERNRQGDLDYKSISKLYELESRFDEEYAAIMQLFKESNVVYKTATSYYFHKRDEGHKIIIWTCRTGDQLLNAINWLLERKIPFDRVNDHDPENIAKYGEGGKKIYAHCYIDDKNIGGFPGWLACVEEIERMEEAYKTILKEDKTKV